MRRLAFGACSVVLVAAGAMRPAQAGPNLVTNGNFETTTLTRSAQITGTVLSGWSTTGYNMLFLPQATVTTGGITTTVLGSTVTLGGTTGPNPSGTTADTTGAATTSNGTLKLWGPNSGSSNGLTTSPDGGNFVAADGDYGVGALSQTLTNLTVGTNYELKFYWAAAQQAGFNGQTTARWTATFGSQSFSTDAVTNASHGFVPWTLASFTFQATSTTQILSFLAAGTPSGAPPFSLLDGVSLTAAPEPASMALLGAGVGILVIARRRGRRGNVRT